MSNAYSINDICKIVNGAYLQQGIAIVLIFIGLKMLAGIIGVHVETYISLMVIVICLAGSIIYSVQIANKRLRK